MSVLNLFGGIAQGLASSVIPLEESERKRQHEQRLQQLDILHGAFQQAADSGDNVKAEHTLRMIAPLMGEKPNKGGPITALADTIKNYTPKTIPVQSQESQVAQENINQVANQPTEPQLVGDSATGTVKTIQPPALTELTRPRMAMEPKVIQQGYYKTPMEKAQTELAIEKQKLKEIELPKFEAERKLIGEQYRQNQGYIFGQKKELEQTKIQGRADLEKIKAQYDLEKKSYYNKRLYDKTHGNPEDATPEQIAEAQAESDQYYNGRINKDKSIADFNDSRAKEVATRHEDRQAKLQIQQQAVNNINTFHSGILSHLQVLEQQGNRKLDQGDIALQIRAKIATPIKQGIDNYNKELDRINRDILSAKRELDSPFLTDQKRKDEIIEHINSLESEYKANQDSLKKSMEQYQEIFKDIAPAKTNNSKVITPPTGPANKTLKASHKVGDVVTVQGKKIKISKIYSDGTFDGDEVQ
jgi:hypothetical protein